MAYKAQIAATIFGSFSILFFLLIVIGPVRTHALGDMADQMCIPARDYTCPCGPPCKPGGLPGGLGCPCFDITDGFKSAGICIAPIKCEGKSLGGMAPMLPMIMPPMKMPKMDMPMPMDAGMDNCYTGRYTTSSSTTDPCADYVPGVSAEISGASGSSGVSSGLLDALKGVTNSISGTLNEVTKNKGTTTKTETQEGGGVKSAAPGLSGDVRIGSAGATIIANLRQGLSEVAGFFGGSTGGASQALSAAGKLCATRPWQGSFVANVIPSAFFDGLCEFRGYQAGIPLPTNSPKAGSTVQQRSLSGGGTNVRLPEFSSDVPPEVDIWAEPASVRLGTRTYIFWSSRGVASCKATGPSFNQTTLSGGAATVPITGSTTFDIECLGAASTTVKDSVTVQISI